LSSEANGLGTVYGTSTTVNGSVTTSTAATTFTISAPTDVYVTVSPITNWNVANTSQAGNIVVSLENFSYQDQASDGLVPVYTNIYGTYKNDLGALINATLTQ
jgi:hypothetical protein